LGMLNKYVLDNGDPSLTRYVILYDALVSEVIEELEDRDTEAIAAFLEYMGSVVSWIGHGDHERLPDVVREFADTLPVPIGS
jgi:hypothetical protein